MRGRWALILYAFDGGSMKAYIITSGAVFGLLTVAHLLRIAFENRHLVTDPVYILITLASAGLSVWAWRVLRPSKQ
jgi:hypothetical protein